MDDVTRKVLAETWVLDNVSPPDHMEERYGHCAVFDTGGRERGLSLVQSRTYIEDNDADSVLLTARARIAACAPEFARLLLEAEWDLEDDGCRWCNVYKPGPHRAGCRWLALMVKAGIRPPQAE